MINITFEDLKNVSFRRYNLDIVLYFTNKNRVLLHFNDFNEYKRYRDFLTGLFLC